MPSKSAVLKERRLIYLKQPGNVKPPGYRAELRCAVFFDFAQSLVYRGYNQVLKHLNIIGICHLGRNDYLFKLSLSVKNNLNGSAACGCLISLVLHFLLHFQHLLLHFLSLLNHMIHISSAAHSARESTLCHLKSILSSFNLKFYL